MNLCFFSGKIVSNIEFKFIIKNNISLKTKHISICCFMLKLANGTIIKINAYDNLADICYRNLGQGDFVAIYGRIDDCFNVELKFCKKFKE